MFFLYDRLVSLAVAALLAPFVALRGAAGRARPGELRDRLGRGGSPRTDGGIRIVLHAVSAGEMAAAGAIAEALGALLPSAAVHLTTGNRDGFAAGERLRRRLPAVASLSFLPWDRRAAVERWLARVDPDAVAVVETEIWPNLFRACGRAGIPLLVVNGRIPDVDFPRYRFARAFFRGVLGDVRGVLAQDEEDARRFVAIGAPAARVRSAGNVKFDAAWSRAAAPPARPAAAVVAGSTHPPEERLLLAAFAELRAEFPGTPLVIAPRHVRRAPAILRRARAAGLAAAAADRSGGGVRVLDAIGGLREAYAEGDVAVVGGTFARRGGHTPLEAAASGCAIVVGPHHASHRAIVSELRDAGAARCVPAGALAAALGELLRDAERRREMGKRARAFAAAGRGAAARCAEEIAAAARQRRTARGVSGREAPAASLPRGSAGRGT